LVRLLKIIPLLLFALLLLPAPAQAATFTDPAFTETVLTTDLDRASGMTIAPDGRIFVLEKDTGNVRIYTDGQVLAAPFLQVSVDSEGERGLLGLAFDPNFATNNFVYIYYTRAQTPVRNVLSRFTADGNTAVPNSELILMELEDVTATNHNGGALAFDANGQLYVGVGDGGNGFADEAQDLTNRFGTILRLNTDGSIPTDNPFYDTLTGPNRAIWAYGLRNPFMVTFDPVTYRLHINDVGQRAFEEINLGQAGANYGWNEYEGDEPYQGGTQPSDYVGPIYTYSHTDTPCDSITAGVFYRGSAFPAQYDGDYFFADYCRGFIRTYDVDTDTVSDFADGFGFGLIDLEISSEGVLYYLKIDGTLGRIADQRADLNNDTRVSPADAVYVVNRLGTDDLSADANGDNAVTEADLDFVLERLGS